MIRAETLVGSAPDGLSPSWTQEACWSQPAAPCASAYLQEETRFSKHSFPQRRSVFMFTAGAISLVQQSLSPSFLKPFFLLFLVFTGRAAAVRNLSIADMEIPLRSYWEV